MCFVRKKILTTQKHARILKSHNTWEDEMNGFTHQWAESEWRTVQDVKEQSVSYTEGATSGLPLFSITVEPC